MTATPNSITQLRDKFAQDAREETPELRWPQKLRVQAMGEFFAKALSEMTDEQVEENLDLLVSCIGDYIISGSRYTLDQNFSK